VRPSESVWRLLRLMAGALAGVAAACCGLALWADVDHRIELFFDYGAKLGVNHIPDFGFAARYHLGATGVALAAAAAILLWRLRRAWWSWLAIVVLVLNLMGIGAFWLMHWSRVLVEYGEATGHGG
jgi:hypothetical protein